VYGVNILLINHYAGSPQHGMEYRPYYLAQEWVRLGHRVQIVAAAQSHVRTVQPRLVGRRTDEVIDGVHYRWYGTPRYHGNGIGRVRNMAAFVFSLFMESRKLAVSFKPDVVIASSTYPMDIWPAHRIAGLAGAKLVFELHDLWPLSPMELGGMSKWHPFILLVRAAEKYVYRHVVAVISILPNVREYMISQGLPSEKLHCVPNGIDLKEWSGDKPVSPTAAIDVIAELKARGLFVVGYAGSHGVANALDGLLDAAALMRDESFAFVLVGGGIEKMRLQARVRAESLSNVWFLDPVKKEQIPQLVQCFDVAYLGFQRQPLYRFGISPNKLMDYMMAARPILMAVEAGNDPVAEANCGLTVKPDDPPAIAQGLRRLRALSSEIREKMGLRGRTFILKNHIYSVLGQRFLDACKA
jgi:glycosyltransferase involved in cell wall biosynthesis